MRMARLRNAFKVDQPAAEIFVFMPRQIPVQSQSCEPGFQGSPSSSQGFRTPECEDRIRPDLSRVARAGSGRFKHNIDRLVPTVPIEQRGALTAATDSRKFYVAAAASATFCTVEIGTETPKPRRRILSEVLRRKDGVVRRNRRAGALPIEFIERSWNESLGIECVLAVSDAECGVRTVEGWSSDFLRKNNGRLRVAGEASMAMRSTGDEICCDRWNCCRSDDLHATGYIMTRIAPLPSSAGAEGDRS